MKRARKPNRPKEVIAAEKAEKAARKVARAEAKQAKAEAKQTKAETKQAKAEAKAVKAKIAGHEAQIKADGERYQKEQLTRDMEHDQSLDDIEDDEELAPRVRNRVTYTPAATALAIVAAKKRGRDAGIALQKRASAKAMDKCIAAYATCMETNGWVLSDAACDNISTETVRSHMKKSCATSEEFLTAFYEVWTEQGWSMGDPVSGEDTDDAEFDNEYRTARFNQ